jgi:hypothetical protein
VEGVREEPAQITLLRVAGAVLLIVCVATVAVVLLLASGGGDSDVFGSLPGFFAGFGVRSLWTARWLGRWEDGAGKRLLCEPGWVWATSRNFTLQPVTAHVRGQVR